MLPAQTLRYTPRGTPCHSIYCYLLPEIDFGRKQHRQAACNIAHMSCFCLNVRFNDRTTCGIRSSLTVCRFWFGIYFFCSFRSNSAVTVILLEPCPFRSGDNSRRPMFASSLLVRADIVLNAVLHRCRWTLLKHEHHRCMQRFEQSEAWSMVSVTTGHRTILLYMHRDEQLRNGNILAYSYDS